jgi:hypothetical protein
MCSGNTVPGSNITPVNGKIGSTSGSCICGTVIAIVAPRSCLFIGQPSEAVKVRYSAGMIHLIFQSHAEVKRSLERCEQMFFRNSQRIDSCLADSPTRKGHFTGMTEERMVCSNISWFQITLDELIEAPTYSELLQTAGRLF